MCPRAQGSKQEMTCRHGTRNTSSLLSSPHYPLRKTALNSCFSGRGSPCSHATCHHHHTHLMGLARGGHLTQASQSEFLSQEFGNRSLWVSQLTPRRHAIGSQRIQSQSRHRMAVTVNEQDPDTGVKQAGVQGRGKECPAPGLAQSPWATSPRGWTVSAGDLS